MYFVDFSILVFIFQIDPDINTTIAPKTEFKAN